MKSASQRLDEESGFATPETNLALHARARWKINEFRFIPRLSSVMEPRRTTESLPSIKAKSSGSRTTGPYGGWTMIWGVIVF